MKQWKSVNIDNVDYVGVIEIENNGDFEVFEILKTPSHIVFGNSTNSCFLQSGNYKIDHDFSFDENLQELIADIESYYSDGIGYQSDRFTCNERM